MSKTKDLNNVWNSNIDSTQDSTIIRRPDWKNKTAINNMETVDDVRIRFREVI